MYYVRLTYAAQYGILIIKKVVKALKNKGLKTTEAQRRASLKWEKENNEKITIKLRVGSDPSKNDIRIAAEQSGQSVNQWIIEAIKDKL